MRSKIDSIWTDNIHFPICIEIIVVDKVIFTQNMDQECKDMILIENHKDKK